jgi:hypothetical protein
MILFLLAFEVCYVLLYESKVTDSIEHRWKQEIVGISNCFNLAEQAEKDVTGDHVCNVTKSCRIYLRIANS